MPQGQFSDFGVTVKIDIFGWEFFFNNLKNGADRTKPEAADFIEAKKELTFKLNLHSRNSVDTKVTSR